MCRMFHLFALLVLAFALTGCAPNVSPAVPSPLVPTLPIAPKLTLTPDSTPTVAPTASSTPTVASTASSTPTVAPTASSTPMPSPTVATTPSAAEILFLRGGVLIALNVVTGTERRLADHVQAFAATPDGRRLALARDDGAATELWLVARNGTNLQQLTTNNRAESSLSWSPDGQSLAYTAASGLAPRVPTWTSWAAWCTTAEVRVIAITDGTERSLGPGCEPSFSPDGQRLAFTTAPTTTLTGMDFPGAINAIQIVNRQGEHGWRLAKADGADSAEGYVVYGATWAPAGDRVAYQRFFGYQALVDINLTELSSSFERKGEPIGFGAGWLLAPQYAPDGTRVAVVEHNFSDSRGFSGYDIWSLKVLRLGEEEPLALPSGTLTLRAATNATLPRATGAAWSPDGTALAVVLPQHWQPGLSAQEPVFSAEGPGELWRWRPGAAPETKLAEGLDFASPLLWLPPLPATDG